MSAQTHKAPARRIAYVDPKPSINIVPKSVLLNIASFLSPKDLSVFAVVSSRFFRVASDNDLWWQHVQNDFCKEKDLQFDEPKNGPRHLNWRRVYTNLANQIWGDSWIMVDMAAPRKSDYPTVVSVIRCPICEEDDLQSVSDDDGDCAG